MIELLRCPESGLPLEAAPRDLVARLLASLKAGTLKTRAGPLPDPFEDALITADGARIYPIRDGIPVLLADEAL